MPAETQTPVLRFDRVSVAFDETPALADVSFQAYEGESRVIMGATGSGKTVLLKTALGLQRPDSGTVYVFGKNLTNKITISAAYPPATADAVVWSEPRTYGIGGRFQF